MNYGCSILELVWYSEFTLARFRTVFTVRFRVFGRLKILLLIIAVVCEYVFTVLIKTI